MLAAPVERRLKAKDGLFMNVALRAGDAHIVDGVAGLREIEGDCGKLLAGAALQEEDLVVVWDAEQGTQVSLGLLYNAGELWAPVGHLHHTDAAALPAQQIGLCLLQHWQRKHSRAC